MTQKQVELLKKALNLYEFVIEQNRIDNYDVYDSNEFFYMQEALSSELGINLCE